MGEGQGLVDLGCVVSALQRTAGLGAIREGAGGGRRGGDLAVLVREARESGLPGGNHTVKADVALVGADGSRKIDLVIVGVGASIAVVGRWHQVLQDAGGDGLDWNTGRVDGSNAIRLVDSLSGEITGEVASTHIGGRHTEQDGCFAGQSQALKAQEEESLVASVVEMGNLKRAAKGAPKVVHDDLRLGVRKCIVCV